MDEWAQDQIRQAPRGEVGGEGKQAEGISITEANKTFSAKGTSQKKGVLETTNSWKSKEGGRG